MPRTTKKDALNEEDYRALISDQFDVNTEKKLYNFLCKFQKFDDALSQQTALASDVSYVFVEFFEEFAPDLVKDKRYSKRVFEFLKQNEFDVRVDHRGRLQYNPPPLYRHKFYTQRYFIEWSSRATELHEYINCKLREWWDPYHHRC